MKFFRLPKVGFRICLHQIQILAVEPGFEFFRKPRLQKRRIVSLQACHDPLHQPAVINIADNNSRYRSLSQLSNGRAVAICIAGL